MSARTVSAARLGEDGKSLIRAGALDVFDDLPQALIGEHACQELPPRLRAPCSEIRSESGFAAIHTFSTFDSAAGRQSQSTEPFRLWTPRSNAIRKSSRSSHRFSASISSYDTRPPVKRDHPLRTATTVTETVIEKDEASAPSEASSYVQIYVQTESVCSGPIS